MTREEFVKHLHAQTYDKLYQDIAPISFIGYSKSHKSWQRIKSLAQWEGSAVVDLGCFHGYFCFRAERAGASKVIGLDTADFALATTRLIAELEDSVVTEFRHWHDNEPIPDADIALCLNALHHFDDPVACMRNIRSKIIILEAPNTQEEMISSVFEIVGRVASHRKGRTIFKAQQQ